MKSVIAFDLIGTLLDLSALDPLFERILGDSQLRKEWFSEVLKLALATTAMNRYVAFSKLAEAALEVVEERNERRLSDQQRQEIFRALRTLPPFPDVNDNLATLHKAGFSIAVLTNSQEEVAEEMLKSAAIRQHFDRVLSADSIQRLKPAPEPYRMAAREFGVTPQSILLVAAHSWDVAGATHAGCQACFLRRPQQVLDEITPKPNLVISDLRELSVRWVELQRTA